MNHLRAPFDAGEPAVYLPEIHDLAPHMAPRLDPMLELLPEAARNRVAWLLVPNWQGVEPLDDAHEFCHRLKALGGTPVLHGWTHSLGPDFTNWLLYGHDNRSEFARLDDQETADRITLGTDMMERVLGIAASWFCAPRWQGNPHLDHELRAAGFEGVMTRTGITRFSAGSHLIPALNFDEGARAAVNAVALSLRARTIRHLLAARKPFRFVLHPDDLVRPAVLAQIKGLLHRLETEGWRPVGLNELFRNAETAA